MNNLGEFRRQSTSFDALVGYQVSAGYLRAAGGIERVMTVQAEREFFTMLGVAPLLGRTFRADDPAGIAVISQAFWQEHLHGDASVLGTAISLDDRSFTIVGVMPAAFQFPYGAASLLPGIGSASRTDVWIPLDLPTGPRVRLGTITGRLKRATSLSAAQSELAVIASRLETQYPDTNAGRSVYLEPLSDVVVGATVRRPLFVLFGAVAIVLALACANVTNLSLVRMTLRGKEIAVRSAIGAGRLRLVRQFLTESLLLALAGGAVGLAFASWGTRQLMRLVLSQIPRAHEVSLDWRVFLFLLAVCAGAAAFSGLLPALFAMRADGQAALQQSGDRTTMSAGQRRVRDSLVVSEVAFALILAVSATMLVRELIRLRNTNIGMVTRNVVTFHLGHRMSPATNVRRFYDVANRVSELQGVKAAGFTQMLPLQNWGWAANSDSFTRVGQPPLPPPVFPIELRYVTPGYFEALGIPVRGRRLSDRNTADTPRVILINETLARRQFGGADPIGVQMNRGTIVGVVGDVRQVGLDDAAAPEICFPRRRTGRSSELGMSLVVRERPSGRVDRGGSIRDSRGRSQPGRVQCQNDGQVVADSLGFTLFLWLMAAFAGLAPTLAVTGTYGVISPYRDIAPSRVRHSNRAGRRSRSA